MNFPKTAIHISAPKCLSEEMLRDVKNAGFDAIGVSFYASSGLLLDEPDWREKVTEIRRLLDKVGLPCVQTHLSCFDIRLSSEIYDETDAARMTRSIEATAMLGAKYGAWHPRTSFNFNCDPERGVNDNVAVLRPFLPILEKFGVVLCVENLPIFPDDKESIFFSSDYHHLIRVVDTLDSPYIRICWDTGHANLMHYAFDQGDALREIGDRLCILHLNSNLGNADVHFTPGIGTVDWAKVIPALQDSGYKGCFALEVSQPKGELAHTYLMHCGESVRWLFQFLHN